MLMKHGPLDIKHCQFVALSCFVTSDTFITKSNQCQTMVKHYKMRVTTCLKDHALLAWFTSVRGVYYAPDPLTILKDIYDLNKDTISHRSDFKNWL